MGLYDTYGSDFTQIKTSNDGKLELRHFMVGDKVPLDNGVYLSSNVLVVVGGELIAVFDKLTDKWGGDVSWSDLLMGRNPVAQAVYELSQEEEWTEADDELGR